MTPEAPKRSLDAPSEAAHREPRTELAKLIRQYHAENARGDHARGAHTTCPNRWCVSATDALVATLDGERLAVALDAAIRDYDGIDDLARKTAALYSAEREAAHRDEHASLMRIAMTLIGEHALLDAMSVWPEGSNGVLAIGAYENLVRRLHARLHSEEEPDAS